MLKTKKNQFDSLNKDAIRRLFANKASVASLIVLSIILIISVFGPMILPNDLDTVYWDYIQSKPTTENFLIFGTDSNGRDLLVRTLSGGRVSISVAIIATLVALVVGVTYGAISGYVGGRTDAVMMRIVDIIYAMPFMFVVILLVVVFGRSIMMIYLALGLVEWLDMARIVRGQTLSLKTKEFIISANALGVSNFSIIRKHIIPNVIGPVVVYMTLTIPKVILIESFLSFLGLGVQEPNTSWGVLISEGTALMEVAPWMLIYPSIFLVVCILAFNFLGDGIRDAFDPKTR
jgi:oligopeptide transport system permease protein